MRCACGTIANRTNLFKGQAAPQMSDDDLTQFLRQRLESLNSGCGIQTIDLRLNEPPLGFRGNGFAMLSSAQVLATSIAPLRTTRYNHATGSSGGAQGNQLEKRLLNDIFGRTAPLPGVQDQCRCMVVDQVRKLLRTHCR